MKTEKITQPFGFAFDLDTTIFNNGKVDDDAITMLRNILINRPTVPILFFSKFNLPETNKLVEEIKFKLNFPNPKIVVSCNNGGYITNGKVALKASMNEKDIQRIRSITEQFAPGSIILYKTKEQNIREKATYTKLFHSKIRKGLTLIFNPILKNYRKFNMYSKPFSDKIIDGFAKRKSILSIEIVAPKKQLKILHKKLSYLDNLCVGDDGSISISNVSKWEVLEQVFKDKAKDVCFFGNNINDRECFLNCESVICPHNKDSRVLEELLFQQNLGKKMFAINDYKSRELLDFFKGKVTGLRGLKFATKLMYEKHKEKKFSQYL